ncbi:DUF4270 family protein [Mucilaginibacter sp. OK283]|uniref:DUF4270 family protein n=1 Tax=Mucilaginibacter sp. OK283 TaxID=1881049 RepID=UPI0008C7A47C|nr:DUF4270 family protein [Mucilaginibacter sp. OK283]SEP27491.1 protein of unknown function [Mucilaginibacter sp. OK283]
MKFFRLDLLTLLISLFIFNSCKRQEGIGLGVDTSTQTSGTLLVDTTVTIKTVDEDTATVVTSGLTKTPLGEFADPVFGTTKTNVALGIQLPTAPYTVPAGTLTIDSAVLVLGYADGFYGDSVVTRYKINVYQLQDKPVNQTYYGTNRWANQGTVLASKTFTANTHDSLTIARIRKDTVDTVQRVAPQLRVPFSKQFIYDHLFNANGTALASNAAFQDAVKGLYLTLQRAQPTNAGGTLQLNLASAGSHLDVFYKAKKDTTTDTASVSLTFPIHAAEIRRQYSETVTKAKTAGGTTQTTVYLQGLGALRAKVGFPGISKLNPDSIVLNRAELVITPVQGSGIPYAPLPKLTMYQLDIAKQRILIQDASASNPLYQTGIFGGFYSNTTKEPVKAYRFVITSYIQDLIRKKTVDYGTYIAPIDATEVNSTTGATGITPSAQIAARSILIGSDNNSSYRIKLNIFYTKIPKL